MVPSLKFLHLNLMSWILFLVGILTAMMVPLGHYYSTFVHSTRDRKILWKFKEEKMYDLTASLQKWDKQIHTQGHKSPNPISKSNINPICTETGVRCT